jgi:hypothetical protein
LGGRLALRRVGRSPVPPPAPGNDRVATHKEELSDPGVEKLIPIRFINLLPCAPGPSCPDNASYANILKAVQAANEVFKAAGIQFALKSVERYDMPAFYDLRGTPNPPNCGSPPDPPCAEDTCVGGGNGDERPWLDVRAQLQKVFTIPDNAWANLNKTSKEWLRAAETVYGLDEELIVFVPQYACGVWAWFPYLGKGLVYTGGTMVQSYKFAHELGHYFGIVHPWDNDTWPDPKTGLAHVRSDEWDLVFKPGVDPQYDPHTFFASKAAAQQYESSLRRIYKRGNVGPPGSQVWIDSCARDPLTAEVSCDVADWDLCHPNCWVEHYAGGSPVATQIKGLAQVVGTGNAANVMSYFGNFSADPYMFSDSQIELIRRYLRYDVQIPQSTADGMQQGTVMSGRRPRLGSWNLREAGARIDFDGDGRRDVGVWIPPTAMGVKGRFLVFLSSKNFSTRAGNTIDVAFGELGDVPVPGDFGCVLGQPGCSTGFEPDGRTDLAVYQPGGGYARNDPSSAQGWWRWCKTPPSPTSMTDAMCACPTGGCTTGFADCGNGCERIASPWGLREDVPLPGLNFMGANIAEVAIFRPGSSGLWAWREANSQSSSGPYRYLGGRGSVLLPGQYDTDSLTDIAVYDPMQATFRLRRSQQTWDTAIARAFDAKFIPQATGTLTNRSGALPLSGVYRTVATFYPKRRAFSLWFPADGTWNTMWDPLNGSTPEVCQWGIGELDVPITYIDRDNDGYTDRAVFRSSVYTSASVEIRNTTASGCRGTSHSVQYVDWPYRIRSRAFGVQDMTGDGKAEIVLLDADRGDILWAPSEWDYTFMHTIPVGNQRAVFF